MYNSHFVDFTKARTEGPMGPDINSKLPLSGCEFKLEGYTYWRMIFCLHKGTVHLPKVTQR